MSNLSIGDQAPPFSFTDTTGKTVNLSDLSGKKVILYFYPRDNTPGCTLEACSLRDGYDELREAGYEVVGVSTDSVKSHEGFRAKYKLPFNLISDPDKGLCEAYGVWGEKKFMGINRTTFVIDEKGRIAAIIDKVNTTDHSKQVLDLMEK